MSPADETGGRDGRARRDRRFFNVIFGPAYAGGRRYGGRENAESYLDTGDKADFEGGAVSRLFPAFGAASAAALWETMGAAPLVQQGAALEKARRMVAAMPVKRRRTQKA